MENALIYWKIHVLAFVPPSHMLLAAELVLYGDCFPDTSANLHGVGVVYEAGKRQMR